jgi:hypothetical protein
MAKSLDERLHRRWENDVRCQPILSVGRSNDQPQLSIIDAVTKREVEGLDPTRQLGRGFM